MLFTDPFLSVASLTSYIHMAWEETEKEFPTNVEVSSESLAHVSAGKKYYIHEGILIVV
jgi:PHD/YefM family antitoxin component YafN of YafNO toxin-antitoxin module